MAAPGFWPPGPGIRMLCFCMIYLAIVILPLGDWWRFAVMIALAFALIPPGGPALRNAIRMLARSVPILVFLGLLVLFFGATGENPAERVFANVMVRTIAAVAAAALIWGGAGTLDFIRALKQLRLPGLPFSIITIAIQSAGRLAQDARATTDALKARSGGRIPFRRRLALFSPLTRHFLIQVVDAHVQIHMAMVSRGYAGGTITVEFPPSHYREWIFFLIFSTIVLGVMII